MNFLGHHGYKLLISLVECELSFFLIVLIHEDDEEVFMDIGKRCNVRPIF